MILTDQEAREILGYDDPTQEMPARVTPILLPAVDNFLKDATGKDWGALTEAYAAIDPTAKMAAAVLLVRWFDDPGQIGQVSDAGILALIGQLEAKALLEAQAAEEAVV